MPLPLRERNTTRLSAVLHHIPPWLGRPPSVRASFFFARRTRCLPDVCLQFALRVGADSLEKPACRRNFTNLISRKFPNGRTGSFVAKTIIWPRKSHSKFAS